MILTDTDIMPFGKHQGKEMQEVPADYLIWLKDNMKGTTMFDGSDKKAVWDYIEDNLEVLEKEAKEDAEKNRYKRRD